MAASVEAGAAANAAEKVKRTKYAQLADRFYFAPVAFETTGACGHSTRLLLKELAAKITEVTGDPREMDWLLQRCAIAIVRGNAASILLGAATEDSALPEAKYATGEPPSGQCRPEIPESRSSGNSRDIQTQRSGELGKSHALMTSPRTHQLYRLSLPSQAPSNQHSRS